MELRPEEEGTSPGKRWRQSIGQKKLHVKNPDVGRAFCVFGRVARMLVTMQEGIRSEMWQDQITRALLAN